ncbi:MAG: M20/M25/M40 family metallo-hydrolase [Gemmatimonadaceae bacterium]
MSSRTIVALLLLAAGPALAQRRPAEPNWAQVEEETMRHFQALLRMDTSDPPGNEQPAVAYLRQVLEREGIPVEVYALEPNRPNLVARLKGSSRKRPILVMGHTDVVNVDSTKWRHPPFSATREGGYVYGRGTVDDKDNVVASLMTLLLLKRQNVPLDRDVIFLAEAGEEGTTRVGIQYMTEQHWPSIDAEYCLAEGGGSARQGGQVRVSAVATTEKIPRAIELVARGPAGHGSVPLKGNAIAHLARAVSAVVAWRTPTRLNETTRTYFERLARNSPPEQAARYRAVVGSDTAAAAAADAWFAEREPASASTLRTSISPNMISGGYRVNVIPSEARATLDVRMLPDENVEGFLEAVRRVVADTAVTVRWAQRDVRPGAAPSPLGSEAFRAIESNVTKHYAAPTLPSMLTGATDMAYLRAKGVQCYGIGPAVDLEDGPLGFGAHSDQERILESELHRFVRFQYDVVRELAGRR